MTNQRLKHNILTKHSSRIFIILLVIYIACILYLTLVCRQSQGRTIEFVPFWSYAEAIRGAQGMWFQILANIAIFVPLGILTGGINTNKKTVMRAAIIGFVRVGRF